MELFISFSSVASFAIIDLSLAHDFAPTPLQCAALIPKPVKFFLENDIGASISSYVLATPFKLKGTAQLIFLDGMSFATPMA